MTASIAESTLTDRFREILKRAGNPFRNYFARNPDDEVCAASTSRSSSRPSATSSTRSSTSTATTR